MSEKYDPVTGELLHQAAGEVSKETTGEVLKEAAEEISEEVLKEAAEEISGEVSKETAAEEGTPNSMADALEEPAAGLNPQEPAMHFDPMTGRPIMTAGGAPTPDFQIMEEKPIKKNYNKLWIALGAVAALIVVIFAVVKSGIFMSNSEKILRAAANTVSYRSHLVEDLTPFSVLISDSYTIELKADVEGAAIEAQYRSGSSEKQLWGSVDIFFFPTIDFMVSITPSQVKMKLPGLDDRVLTYNYMEEKNGYITEFYSKEELDEIDAVFQAVFSERDQKSIGIEISKALTKWYHSLDFEKAESREFKVNGQTRKCTGYKLTGIREPLQDILEELEAIVEKNYKKEEMEYAGIDYLFEEWRYLIEDMQDIDMTFYLYKNQLVCALMEADGEELQILLESDKKGNLNIEYIFYDETVMQIERIIGNSTEKYVYCIEDYLGDFNMELEYDYKSGDISLELEDYYSDYVMKGSLESDAKSISLTIDTIEEDGEDADAAFTLSVKKGASMQELEGEEVDVGSLSEAGWRALENELSWY